MYQRISIVDSKAESRAAFLEGTALAKAHGREAVLFAVLPSDVMPLADMAMFADISPKQFEREARSSADRMLAAATAVADKAGIKSSTASAAVDDAALVFVSAARRRKCDVIVVATEGRNALLRLLTGCVIPGLITSSHVPVLGCRPKTAKRYADRAAVVPPYRSRKASAPSTVRRCRAKA